MQSNTFDLFVIPGALPPVIHLAQYDNARTFEASLKNADGSAYMPPEGMTATFEGTNRLGGQYQIECEVDGANVTFTPDGNATNQWGRTAATITLRDGDDQITALNIIVDVQRAGVTNEEAAENPGFTDRIAQALTEYGARFGAVTRFYNAEISDSGAISSSNLIPHDDLKINDIILTKNNRIGYISSVSPMTVALFEGNFLNVGAGGGSVETVNGVSPDASGNVDLEPSDIGAYAKPAGGIPESDIATAVKNKLATANPADAATSTLTKLLLGGTVYSIPQGGSGSSTTIVTVNGSTASMSSSQIAAAAQTDCVVLDVSIDGVMRRMELVSVGSNAALFSGVDSYGGSIVLMAATIIGFTASYGIAGYIQGTAIEDAGGYFTSDTVEGALAEVGAQLDGLTDALGDINDVLEGAL